MRTMLQNQILSQTDPIIVVHLIRDPNMKGGVILQDGFMFGLLTGGGTREARGRERPRAAGSAPQSCLVSRRYSQLRVPNSLNYDVLCAFSNTGLPEG